MSKQPDNIIVTGTNGSGQATSIDDQILDLLSDCKISGRSMDGFYWFQCPNHNDIDPSAWWNPEGKDNKDPQGIWGCRVCPDVGDSNNLLAALLHPNYEDDLNGHVEVPIPRTVGFTLADARMLVPSAQLQKYGFVEIIWTDGLPAVLCPYTDTKGHTVANRYRIALTGDRFRWGPGLKKIGLFGLQHFDTRQQTAWLVEGETDVLILDYFGENAVGLPSGGSWREERDAKYLAGIKKIFVPYEHDDTSYKALRKLRRSDIYMRVWVADFSDFKLNGKPCKDPRDLWKADPDKYTQRLARIKARAIPLAEWLVESEEPRFKLLTLADMKKRPTPKFLVEDVIVERSLGMMHGRESSYKTAVMVDIACCVATGHSWHGHDVKRGRVVYVCAEGEDAFVKRVEAWEQATGLRVGDNLLILPDAPQLMDRQDLQDFMAVLPEDVVLIIFDTLADIFDGYDENATKDATGLMGAAGRLKRDTGAAVYFVHHNALNTDRSRGNSSLRAKMDTIISARADGDYLTLRCRKMRDWAMFAPITLEREVVELEDGESSIYLQSTSKTAETAPENRSKVVDALKENFAAEEGATYTQWQAKCDVAPRTFDRARKKALEDGLVKLGSDKRYRPVQ
jgi:hypothetical protein